MYKLNTHDLYGLSNDYYRRGGNFEFQFSGPESIPNAVKRYNKQRAAELAQMRKEREPSRPSMPRFCKVRRSGNDVLSMVTSRDLDVETQLSLEAGQMLDELEEDESHPVKDDTVAKVEPERLCGGTDGKTKTKSKKSKSKSKKKTIAEKGDDACQQIEALHREVCAELHFMESVSPVMPLQTPLTPQAAVPSKQKHSTASPKRQHKREARDARDAQGKAEEVLKRLKVALFAQRQEVDACEPAPQSSQSAESGEGGEGDRIYPQTNSISYEDYPQQQAQWVDIMPSAMMWQAIQVNVCNADNATPMAAYEFMDQHGSIEPEPMTPFFLEDGDLEHEYANRPDYLRYLEPRPTCPSSEPDQAPTPDQICTDSAATAAFGDQREIRFPAAVRQPCFVELEHRPHRISLLRSMQPMRYTSQRSEETHVPSEDNVGKEKLLQVQKDEKEKVEKERAKKPKGKQEQIKKEKSVETKSMTKKSAASPTPKSQKSSKLKTEKPNGKTQNSRQAAGSSLSPSGAKGSSNKQQGRQKSKSKSKTTKTEETKCRHQGGRDVSNNVSNVPPSIPAPPSPARVSVSPVNEKAPTRRRKHQRPHATLVCSKSLENLKFEKLTIYNKISMTQERIIGSLDRLQNSLLQLHVPNCNALERQRRERNAFEFCVRFARNFLYPLKGMIDDVRSTSVASFNSAKSNEACQRVVCVYGLIQQSVQTFQRQLRYFLLDKVPQKLSALIEMIYTMTNVCLEKGIMDRQDPVVECLQQRCTKFLTFIEDMQEERFQLARETYRRLKKRGHKMNRPRYHHYHRTQSEVRCQRYDLKMCLNDLKFYEPRLVPRKDKRPRPLLRVRKMKGNTGASGTAGTALGAAGGGASVVQITSNAELPPAIDQMVVTQIENIQCRGDASSAMSLNLNSKVSNFNDHQPCCSRKAKERKSQQQKMEQGLHEALFEALQHVSKNQVHQVLDPILRSLETILQKQAPPSKN